MIQKTNKTNLPIGTIVEIIECSKHDPKHEGKTGFYTGYNFDRALLGVRFPTNRTSYVNCWATRLHKVTL
jgi:hypothetical protein